MEIGISDLICRTGFAIHVLAHKKRAAPHHDGGEIVEEGRPGASTVVIIYQTNRPSKRRVAIAVFLEAITALPPTNLTGPMRS